MQTLVAVVLAITVFTANQGSHTVSAVDPNSGSVRTLALSIAPHNVQTCGQRNVFVVGFVNASGSSEMAMGEPGKLISIDPVALRVRAAIDIGVSPAHVVCDSRGRFAYVTLSSSNAVAIVDVETMTIAAKIPVGEYPHGLRMSDDDRLLFVANAREGSISVIDLRSRKELKRIAVGGQPSQVAVSPDGRAVYATLSDTNEVIAVNVAAGRVTKRLRVGTNPAQIAINAEGTMLVAADEGTFDSPGSDVAIINPATLRPIASVDIRNGPYGVAIEGDRAYVTSVFAGTLTVIDLTKYRAIRTFALGAEPAGVTVYP